ncbi:agamous-like mads-box protein agl92 [Phtheirospermum japonicum]|uniref:Agamous-like mads-box protein agl92 n=1 Tax=Phtheirospermum japonicum TaxID=374723 RepID=A0A830BEP2_9LAMI|nr:agamous-like mads-box protein agl92 [Phtheirospermum japonicum]
MGRAKLKMELIADKKSRNTTFNNRKEGLIKKTHELTKLCDVEACVIIYRPGFTEPEIWPPCADQVRRFITDVYKPTKGKDSGSKTYGLSDFFKGRVQKVEGELAKLRKKNMEAKYPTRPEVMDAMSEARLREFAAALKHKSDYVKSRIEFLRRNKEATMGMNLLDPGLAQLDGLSNSGFGGIESHSIQQYPTNTIDHHQQQLHAVNQNSMGMVLMNDRFVQFGAGPSVQFQAFYDAAGNGPKPLARHYGPPLPVQGQGPYMQMLPYMQMMPAVAMPAQWPELQLWTKPENDCGNEQKDVVAHDQYQIIHNRARYYNE